MGYRGVLWCTGQGGRARRTSPLTPARGAKKTASARLSPGAFCFYLQELSHSPPPHEDPFLANTGRQWGGRESCRILVREPVQNAHRRGNPQVFGFTSVIATRAACGAGGKVVGCWSANAFETHNRPGNPQVFGFTSVIPQ